MGGGDDKGPRDVLPPAGVERMIGAIGGLRCERHAPVAPPADGRKRLPVVAVHGILSEARSFRPFAEGLALAGYEVLAVNLPGHGPGADRSLIPGLRGAELVSAVREVVRAVGPCALIGKSFGGLIVQALADEPAARALVPMVSTPPPGVRVRLSWRTKLALGFAFLPTLWQALFRPTFRYSFRFYYRFLCTPGTPVERARGWFAQGTSPESSRLMREQMMDGIPVPPGPTTKPMLVIAGALDPVLGPATQARVAAYWGGELRVYEGVAHLVTLEPGADARARDLAAWLDQNLATADLVASGER